MHSEIQAKYEKYVHHLRTLSDLNAAIALMAWDKEVYMPPKGAHFRAQQMATLEGMWHQKFTEPDFVALVQHLHERHEQLDESATINVQRTWQDLSRSLKLDRHFIERRSRATSEAYQAWLAARKFNDYERFAPALQTLVEVKREEAQRLGYQAHPYDALLETFEPGERVAHLEALFYSLRDALVPLVQELQRQPQVNADFLHQYYPADEQWELGIDLLRNMGYDFEAGRQDRSPHPFTISFSPQDVRVTTRIDPNNLAQMTWSCIHEGGHALYEQGLPTTQYGLPIGQPASLGIHESQSRLWENHVGRSCWWWQYHYPKLQQRFPNQLSQVSLDEFWRGINKVAPNLIRTEADELHYHLHIIIRFEIEKALIEGSLSVNELDKVWNERYTTYLGITPPDARSGILQDVHWGHGSFGYFPTYTLGSLYAAQFFHKCLTDIPQLPEQLSKGNCQALHSWLRETIHRHGRRYLAEELCQKVTGSKLDSTHFLQYATEKFYHTYKITI